MRKIVTALATAAFAAGLLTMPAATAAPLPTKPAYAGTVKAHKPYTIERVKVELKKPAVQKVIRREGGKLRAQARKYGTTYTFERDARVCELTYRPLHKPEHRNYFDDPAALALSACINMTISSHNMVD